MEEFKIIKDYPKYSISNIGNVKNNKTQNILKKRADRYGYHYVILGTKPNKKFYRIHRLVGLHFIENPNNKLTIDHIDNNKMNNNVLNLRWATHEENFYNKRIYKNNTSGYKGVHFNKNTNKWISYTYSNKKQIYLGCFDNLEEAIKIRKETANKLYGDFINSCEKI